MNIDMIEYENLAKVNKKLFSSYEESFKEFLKSGWYILGEKVRDFESEFAHYCNSKYCIGVASGLDALILTIDALGLPKESEIIVQSNTYIATILAVIRNGHKAVLVEPDIESYNLDPEKINQKITSKTKAVIVTHLYGKPCDMKGIQEICNEYGLELIEDCAQAHGAKFNDQIVGSFGHGCFSFYPTKNLGALGDAGAITTNSENLYDRLTSLRNYGSSKKYYNDHIGYNSRLDEVQAALLSIKLKYLDDINSHKKKLADMYHNNISDNFIKPRRNEFEFDVFHIYNIRHKKRDQIRGYLLENGIKTEIHYPIPPHKQKAMQGILQGDFPISEEIHLTTLSLPISFFHTEENINFVIKTLNEFDE